MILHHISKGLNGHVSLKDLHLTFEEYAANPLIKLNPLSYSVNENTDVGMVDLGKTLKGLLNLRNFTLSLSWYSPELRNSHRLK